MQAQDIRPPAQPKPKTHVYGIITGCVAVIAVLGAGWLGIQYQKHTLEIEQLTESATEANLQYQAELAVASSTATALSDELSSLKKNLENLADDYKDERNRNEEFEDQIRDLSSTLGDLDKLAKIDEELLQKYSKVYFLNENYIPERVSKIDDKYVLEDKGDQYFHARAIDHLEDMFKDAARDDIDLKVISAYRSFDEQTDLKGQFTQVYGSGANTFSADQGYSEHQLGTTLDLTVAGVGGTYTNFAQTDAYEWLLDNAHKHGFIISYPEDNGFYIFEPWHWRFVGQDLAQDLNRKNESFYDLEQREINEYLLELFD